MAAGCTVCPAASAVEVMWVASVGFSGVVFGQVAETHTWSQVVSAEEAVAMAVMAVMAVAVAKEVAVAKAEARAVEAVATAEAVMVG